MIALSEVPQRIAVGGGPTQFFEYGTSRPVIEEGREHVHRRIQVHRPSGRVSKLSFDLIGLVARGFGNPSKNTQVEQEPVFLHLCHNLDQEQLGVHVGIEKALAAQFVYESAVEIGNNSGPVHSADGFGTVHPTALALRASRPVREGVTRVLLQHELD